MNRLSRPALLLSILFAVLMISPGIFSGQFGPYPLSKTVDVMDILAPLIVIPLYWVLFQVSRGKRPSLGETIVFLVPAASWV